MRLTIGRNSAAALRVFAAVLAQVLVLLDVGLERRRLLGGRERACRRR